MLPREAVAALMAQAAAVQTVLAARGLALAVAREPSLASLAITAAPPETGDWITVAQAGQIIGHAPRWFYRRRPPFMHKIGGGWRINRRELVKWLERQ